MFKFNFFPYRLNELSKIDEWFLHKMRNIVDFQGKLVWVSFFLVVF